MKKNFIIEMLNITVNKVNSQTQRDHNTHKEYDKMEENKND